MYNTVKSITYIYGGKNPSAYGNNSFETPEEAYASCNKARIDQILNGWKPMEEEWVWKDTFERTVDDNGETIRRSSVMERLENIPLSDVLGMTSKQWVHEIFNRFMQKLSNRKVSSAGIKQFISVVESELLYKGYMSMDDYEPLVWAIERNMNFARHLGGSFTEGNEVEVNVCGTVCFRKVKYSKAAGDLYVIVDGEKYFYCEFDDMTGDK